MSHHSVSLGLGLIEYAHLELQMLRFAVVESLLVHRYIVVIFRFSPSIFNELLQSNLLFLILNST